MSCIDWHGQPLVVGEIRASHDAERAPTVLCYGHFDVQPADPLELWESAPFEPEIRGEYVYGRGVADDKGQLYLLLCAARELAAAGELPINVRFACDGEEETGGHSIVEFLHQDERGADAAVIFDSGMVRRGLPAFNVATRGMAYFHLHLRTGARDLHSGIYGGAALNAAHALVVTLSSVIAADGRLAEPLRAGIIAPTSEELDGWRELPAGAAELDGQGARPADPRAAEEFYLRTFAEPALDVNGVHSGSPARDQDRGAVGRRGQPIGPPGPGTAGGRNRRRARAAPCATPPRPAPSSSSSCATRRLRVSWPRIPAPFNSGSMRLSAHSACVRC